MIKNILYVEDGSVDVDELKEGLSPETKIIVYRQGSAIPRLVQVEKPIAEKEFSVDEEAVRRYYVEKMLELLKHDRSKVSNEYCRSTSSFQAAILRAQTDVYDKLINELQKSIIEEV